MEINFSLDKHTNIYKSQIKKLFNKALEITNKPQNISVNVVLIDDEQIKQMNKQYRNVDKVTDVLSFPMVEDFNNLKNEFDFFSGECNIGDIYINLNKAKQQAKEYGHSTKREFCFLAVHGFLHLLGYDHITEPQEEEMTAIQRMVFQDC